MKWVLWLLGLFAVAVASAFIAGQNDGTVSIFWAPYRFDLSFNLFVLILILGFVFAYGVSRGVSALLDLPRQARRWRMLQKERAVHAALLESLALMLTGRYLRARKAAQQTLELEQDLRQGAGWGETLPKHLGSLRIMAELVAAESAHSLRDRVVRDQHLARALSQDPQGQSSQWAESMDAARLSAARWTLGDRDATKALAQLDDLPRGLARRTLALRLRLKASRLVRNHVLALETARLLTKHGAFTRQASDSLLRSLALSSLAECEDTDQMSRLWGQLTPAEVQDAELARAAASQWLTLAGEPGRALQWLLPQWTAWVQKPDDSTEGERSALTQVMEVALSALPPDADWLQRMDRAAQQWPQLAEMHYLAACVFMRHGLWGKAQQALERCAARLSHPDLRRKAWIRLAELAEQRGAVEVAAQHWKKAAKA
ncbi:MAG: heme biosynthesis HemY N-terminal domain-containing protein [Alphaproteobacteria bacterium]|nr:heme biosynthesis HemY N-terminal domain-containing protein [Alphaproteobacteria bacterium]